MGIGLYRRVLDSTMLPSSASQHRDGYLQEYRLDDDGTGRVRTTWVPTLKRLSGVSEIEAIAVNDGLVALLYAARVTATSTSTCRSGSPGRGARTRALRPDHRFRGGSQGDRHLHARDEKTGYIVCTDQLDGNSEFHVYRREGAPGNPHDHTESC